MASEAKVGLLFIVAVVLVVGTASYLSSNYMWMTGRHIHVHFENVEGLTEGAKVVFSGMEIGRVLDIRLATPEELRTHKEKPIVAHLFIQKDVVLKDSDKFVVMQSGLLGDTHITVRRKTKKQVEADAILGIDSSGPPKVLESGSHVEGLKAVGITELGDDVRLLLAQVKSAVEDFKSLYAGPEFRQQLPAILANVELATMNAVEFTQVLSELAVDNQQEVGVIARQISMAASELNGSARRIRKMVDASAPGVESATSRVGQMIDVAAGNVEAASGYLKETGELVVASAEDIEASTRQARATLTQVSGRIDELVTKSAADIEKTTGYVEETTRVSSERLQKLMDSSAGNIENAAASVEKATSQLAQLVETSGQDISQSSKRINELVQKTAADIEVSSGHLAKMSEELHGDLSSISGNARAMVETSTADIQKTTARVASLTERSADDIERTTRRIHDLLATSPVPNDLAAASAHIRKSAENVSSITEGFRKTLADPQFDQAIRKTVDNLAAASDHLVSLGAESELLVRDGRKQITDEKMWEDIRAVVARLKTTADDLNAITQHARELITDEQLTEDVKQTVTNVRHITARGGSLADQAEATLTRVNDTMDNVNSLSSRLQPTYSRGYASLEAIEEFGLRADVTADLFFDKRKKDYWRLGVRDVGDKETLIFQRGIGLKGDDALRFGVLGGELAVGYDTRLNRRLSAEMDVWNPNDVTLDARLKWELAPNWQLMLGASDIGGETEPSAGVRRNFDFSGKPPTAVDKRRSGLTRAKPSGPQTLETETE